ncbi:MAG: sigma-70 family RNA polymerase sigma factor [Candidatus Omnitrophota bacterium]
MLKISDDTIKRAAEGDMEAFEEIYRYSSGYVHSVAYRITGNRQDAEEVTQDVFVRVYRKLGTFGFRSAFSTWLYRIAMNTAINLYRKKSKERGKTIPFDDAVAADKYGEGKEEGNNIDGEDNEKLVRSMLESLPEGQRACVILRNIEGLKYEEVARALGINLNTVRSRLNRARERLISLYGKRGKDL